MQQLFKELINYDGRFSRMQYWLYSIAIEVTLRILFFLFIYYMPFMLGIPMIVIIGIAGFYFQICVQIKRAHDLGKPGTFIWLCYIPIVNLYPTILFGFFRGDIGTNTYGSDPIQV